MNDNVVTGVALEKRGLPWHKEWKKNSSFFWSKYFSVDSFSLTAFEFEHSRKRSPKTQETDLLNKQSRY